MMTYEEAHEQAEAHLSLMFTGGMMVMAAIEHPGENVRPRTPRDQYMRANVYTVLARELRRDLPDYVGPQMAPGQHMDLRVLKEMAEIDVEEGLLESLPRALEEITHELTNLADTYPSSS